MKGDVSAHPFESEMSPVANVSGSDVEIPEENRHCRAKAYLTALPGIWH